MTMPENIDLLQLDKDIEYFKKKLAVCAHSPTSSARTREYLAQLELARAQYTNSRGLRMP